MLIFKVSVIKIILLTVMNNVCSTYSINFVMEFLLQLDQLLDRLSATKLGDMMYNCFPGGSSQPLV